MPKFSNLLLQICGRKCKRKGGVGGRKEEAEVAETETGEKNQQARKEKR